MFFAPKLVVNYAVALFKAAGNNPKISDQLQDLNKLISQLHINYNERLFIYDDSCKAILDTVKKQNFDPIIINLATKLLDKRRLDILPKLILYFEELRRNSLGIEIAQVRSARKLNAKEIKDISLYLDKCFDKKFEIENVIDPTLIGGVKVIFDSFLLDNSVEGKLRKIKNDILNSV